MKKLVLGIIIADDYEYTPFLDFSKKYKPIQTVIYKNEAFQFKWNENTDILCIKCGTGKVNAAMAASVLICTYKCDMILNAGLSGAIDNVHRGDIVAGSQYQECDFDLTAIGREPGYKPGQEYIYHADETLLALAERCSVDVCGKLGTGDIFLADTQKKEEFRKLFRICAFDMESAAIAGVCYKCNTPFLSIRKISDDCDGDAVENYRDMNHRREMHLSEILYELFEKITGCEVFYEA